MAALLPRAELLRASERAIGHLQAEVHAIQSKAADAPTGRPSLPPECAILLDHVDGLAGLLASQESEHEGGGHSASEAGGRRTRSRASARDSGGESEADRPLRSNRSTRLTRQSSEASVEASGRETRGGRRRLRSEHLPPVEEGKDGETEEGDGEDADDDDDDDEAREGDEGEDDESGEDDEDGDEEDDGSDEASDDVTDDDDSLDDSDGGQVLPIETLMGLWKLINNHKVAVIFRYPVSEQEAPGYHEAIKTPMDLDTLRQRIEGRQVSTLGGFKRDVLLICNNAMEFNGEGSDYYAYAEELMEFARKTIAERPSGDVADIREQRRRRRDEALAARQAREAANSRRRAARAKKARNSSTRRSGGGGGGGGGGRGVTSTPVSRRRKSEREAASEASADDSAPTRSLRRVTRKRGVSDGDVTPSAPSPRPASTRSAKRTRRQRSMD